LRSFTATSLKTHPTLTERANILDLGPEGILRWCVDEELPAYRAAQISEWLWKKAAMSFQAMSSLPASLRERLDSCFRLQRLEEDLRQQSKDGTRKSVFILEDKQRVEAVLIPSASRTTLCVSTQAGCPLACTFCATGHAGFSRNLKAWEIFDQYRHLNQLSIETWGRPIDNIVYMGMGEPMLNYEATISSVRMLADEQYGPGFSSRRVTLSTAGIPEGIRRLGDENLRCELAVSLHSAIQEKREILMPVAKRYTLTELSDALVDYHAMTNGRPTMEVLLMGGVNDGDEDLSALATYCKAFPVKINLIRYNAFEGSPYHAPDEERVKKWMEGLEKRNMIVNLRNSKGGDIAAACGQLAGKTGPAN
jgi:23S rRNA (adenine2503-C2)-methyltransferase